MKARVFALLLPALLAACGWTGGSAEAREKSGTENVAENISENTPESDAATPGGELRDGVEVLSFHTRKRCPTCRAIEQLTREVVAGEFAAQLADGSLRLHVAEISEEPELAERYRVTWSSLLVCRRSNGQEQVVDLTRTAFAHARTAPDLFRQELKEQIEQMLRR